jgi:hypothetical protein
VETRRIWQAIVRSSALCLKIPATNIDSSSQPPRHFLQLPLVSTMDAKTQRRQDVTLSSLNVAIEAMNLAKEIASVTPAKAVFGSVSVILAMIKVSFLPVCIVRLQADEYRIL